MSQLSIMLGLKKYEPPKSRYDHLRELNQRKKDVRYNEVKAIMRDLVMSTSDLAARLEINRDSAARYLAKLRREGKAEKVGETVHPGMNARVDVWKLV